MGEGPEAAGSLGGRWGMKRRTLMRSILSQEMWMVISCPDARLWININKEDKSFFLKKTTFNLIISFCEDIYTQNQARRPNS